MTSTPKLEGGWIVVFDAAAATVTTGVAMGATIDGRTHDKSLHMQHPACWKNGIAIKTKPRILVIRHNTRYYNLVWAIG
jgi:hypothetical protein